LLNNDDGAKSSVGTPPGDIARVDASRGLVAASEQPAIAAAATLATRVRRIPRIVAPQEEGQRYSRSTADDEDELEDTIQSYLMPADRTGCEQYHRAMRAS
jgi:hypothetical protein